MLPYTLCFIRHRWLGDDVVLMLKREKSPNKNLWNGVGGKIESGETPTQSVLREVSEETGLIVSNVRFGGIVTWEGAPETGTSGMYVYTADWNEKITRSNVHLTGPRDVEEGTLRWMPTEWCCEPSHVLVDNIPHFLPPIINAAPPCEFFCAYDDGGTLVSITRHDLADDVITLATKA